MTTTITIATESSKTNFSSWLDYVLPSLPGATSAMAIQTIRETSIDFCIRTRYWHYDFTSDLVADDPLYVFAPSDVSEMASVIWLKIIRESTDHWLRSTTPESLLQTDNSWQTTTDIIAAKYFRENEQLVRLYPIPNTLIASGFQGRIALKPVVTATQIVTKIFTNHREAIACGVKARMMEQPSKPYTNLELALYYWKRYHSEVGGVRQSVMKSLTDGSLSVQIPSW